MQRSVPFTVFVLIWLIGLFFVTGCQSDQAHREDEGHHHAAEEEEHSSVHLSAEEITELGITVQKAAGGELRTTIMLTGEIIIPPDNLAHIHPRFPGLVKQVFKHIGDPVQKGETLAIIEGNESLSEYAVKSLISGTVVEKHLSLGEVVEDREHGFVIANLQELWAMLNIYQKDLAAIRIGQSVTISAGPGMPETQATIDYVSPLIEEATRTATARVVMKNADQRWKPGLFVTGTVTSGKHKAEILVPRSALFNLDDQTVIFVPEEEGFHAQHVKVGLMNKDYAEIRSGLPAGREYVAQGGFTIKSEMQKASFGGHVH